MEYLYDTEQQSVLNKTSLGEILTLNDVKIILKDVNNFKMSQHPDTDLVTYKYKTDIQLMNKYVSEKYSDSIYYYDVSNNIKRFFING